MNHVLSPLPEGLVIGESVEIWRDLGQQADGRLYLGLETAAGTPRRRLVLARPAATPPDQRVPGAPARHAGLPAVLQVCDLPDQQLLVLDCLPGTRLSELAPVADDELLLRLGHGLATALIAMAALGGPAGPLSLAEFVLVPSGEVRYVGPVLAGEPLPPTALRDLLTRLIEPAATWTEEVAAAWLHLEDWAASRARFGDLLDHAPVATEAGLRSEIGPSRRRNEDSALHLCLQMEAGAHPTDLEIVAVADGMGGHRAGDVASRVALAALVSDLALSHAVGQAAGAPLPEGTGTALIVALTSAFHAACEAVAGLAEPGEPSPPGTTLVAALRLGRRLLVGNVGDSRAYLYRAGRLERLSRDDSYAQELVDNAGLTEREARDDPRGHCVTQCIGLGGLAEPRFRSRWLQAGDRLVLCTDGVSAPLNDTRIAAVLAACPAPEIAAEALIWAAQEAGGTDNLTAALLEMRSES